MACQAHNQEIVLGIKVDHAVMIEVIVIGMNYSMEYGAKMFWKSGTLSTEHSDSISQFRSKGILLADDLLL